MGLRCCDTMRLMPCMHSWSVGGAAYRDDDCLTQLILIGCDENKGFLTRSFWPSDSACYRWSGGVPVETADGGVMN
jgi:hypothetical protein